MVLSPAILDFLKIYLHFEKCKYIIEPASLKKALIKAEGIGMAVSYKKLWKMMVEKGLSKTELTQLAGISTNAMAKLGRNEDVRVRTLEKLCTSLDCNLDDIVEFVPDKGDRKPANKKSSPKMSLTEEKFAGRRHKKRA